MLSTGLCRVTAKAAAAEPCTRENALTCGATGAPTAKSTDRVRAGVMIEASRPAYGRRTRDRLPRRGGHPASHPEAKRADAAGHHRDRGSPDCDEDERSRPLNQTPWSATANCWSWRKAGLRAAGRDGALHSSATRPASITSPGNGLRRQTPFLSPYRGRRTACPTYAQGSSRRLV